MDKFSISIKIIGLMLFITIAAGIWSMSFSHAYHNEMQAHLNAARHVLIKHGLCKNQNDCTSNRLLFGSNEMIRFGSHEFGGIQIEVYGVSDPDIVVELIDVITSMHEQHTDPRVQIDVYKSRHSDFKVYFAEFIIE